MRPDTKDTLYFNRRTSSDKVMNSIHRPFPGFHSGGISSDFGKYS